jgi:hypothetical protein
MLPTEDLFVYACVLIHDVILAGSIAVPAGLASPVSWPRWPRDRTRLFPVLPHHSEANRCTRWLRRAFEQFRLALAAQLPEDDCQQADTSALAAKCPSLVRGPDQWNLTVISAVARCRSR